MSDTFSNEPMLEMYIFETSQQLEQLEQAIITSEKTGGYSQNQIGKFKLKRKKQTASYNEMEQLSPEILKMLESMNHKNKTGMEKPKKSSVQKIALSDNEFAKY